MAFEGSYDGDQITITMKSGAAVTKWECVTIASQADGVCIDCAGAGVQVLGVAQNAAGAAGESVKICVIGVTKVRAGNAVTKMASLQTDATGRVIAAASADEVCGVAIEAAAAAGDIITAVVNYAGIY